MIWYNEHSQKGQFPLNEDHLQVKLLSDECILAVMADSTFTDSLGGSYLTNCLRGKGFRETPSVEKIELPKAFHVRICTDGFYNPDSKDDSSVIDIFGD